MEKELEVARTIQETLVPGNDTVDRQFIKLAGYFQPASQCGGDWWTYHDLKDGKVFKTGFYLNELMQPVQALLDAGHEITFATPKGMAPSVDTTSIDKMYFGGDEAAMKASEAQLSEAMVRYWTAFARDGRPVAAGAADWRPYGEDEAFVAFRDEPRAEKDLFPGMFELHEEAVRRRRDAGDQSWNWNAGLASPRLAPP